MVKKVSAAVPARAATPKRRRQKLKIDPEEERICGKAAAYCIRNFPMLWTVGGIKEEKGDDGSRRWIIAVYLRYPTGHEGYVGDLLYDGQEFTQLTPREIMKERSRTIAEDPALQREWDAYRASTVSARNA